MKKAGIIILCIGVLALVGLAIGSAGVDLGAFILPVVGLGLLIAGIVKDRK